LINRDPTVSRLLESSRGQAAQIGTLQKQNRELFSHLAALEQTVQRMVRNPVKRTATGKRKAMN